MGVVDKLIQKQKTSGKAGEFIALLFSSRDCAHLMHLKTISFAAHKALNEYYDDIVGLADGICESIQGKYGLLSIPEVCGTYSDPIKYFENLANTIETMRTQIPQDSYIQNQVDGVVELIYSTLYKLKILH